MGQTHTKYSHQYGLDPQGYHNAVVPPHDCKRRTADGFQCDGICFERPPFSVHENLYSAGARSQHKARRQHHVGRVKASSSPCRRVHSRNTSNTSNISKTSTPKLRKRSPSLASPTPSATPEQFAVSVSKTITIPVEEQALCFFLANWVLIPQQGQTGGYMEYLVPLYSQCKPNSHLYYALSAASLAAFGNRPSCKRSSSQSVSAKASLMYAKALEYTSRALKDPSSNKDDETLAAVLMLGTFEVCYMQRNQSNPLTGG